MSVKSDVCPEDDLQTFYPSEADGKNVLDDPNSFIRTQLTKLGSSHEKFDVWPMPKTPITLVSHLYCKQNM